MRKPPVPKKQQHGYIHTAVRLPPELHADIKSEADSKVVSMNAVIIARLQKDSLSELRAEVAELRTMLREVLDIVRDKL